MLDFLRRRRIYLDNASATPVLSEVVRAMHSEEAFANPGAIHADGVSAKRMLEEARETIAAELGCKPRQVVFTSGLTESNNLAILGFARKLVLAGTPLESTHWIVSAIEHDSVLECFAEIERLGGVVSHADPDAKGIVTPEKIQRLLRPETVFVSVGWANNEIGVIQPLRAIAHLLSSGKTAARIVFHSDAGQGPLYLFPHVHTLGVDLFSLGAGKLYGPRGVGALYVNDKTLIAPTMLGGSQEGGLRAGTEEPVLAAGFARAFETISKERNGEAIRLSRLRDSLARELSARIEGLVINGDLKQALPHMLNISVPNISSEYLVLGLDHEGISISTKSACREGEQFSHVVEALGRAKNPASSKIMTKEERAKNTLRFSLGRDTTASDIIRTVKALERVTRRTAIFAESRIK